MDNGWTLKRYLRSVNNLHLWNENPRLDPSDIYVTTKDYVEGMFRNESGREDFINLAKSIVENGFLSLDPVVVWKNEKGQFVVAEGNRRVAVLKLLLEPTKAPNAVRRAFIAFSSKIDKSQYEKINVCLAPSFEACIWYINQRHEAKSTQKRWGRENYMLWISNLYTKFGNDINRISSFTGAAESDITKIICVLNLKEKLTKELDGLLSSEEIDQMSSTQFPITTFERVVNNSVARAFFKMTFDGLNVKVKAEYNSFLNAFAEFLHRLMLPRTDEKYLDSRKLNTSESIEEMLKQLPKVEDGDDEKIIGDQETPSDNGNWSSQNKKNTSKPERNTDIEINNPNRSHLIPKECYIVTTDYRLDKLFNELKRLSGRSFPNVSCASLRVFLDISVRDYILDKGWKQELVSQNKGKDFERIELASRLSFLNIKFQNKELKNITQMLTNPQNEFSVNTLNRYIHSNQTYAIDRVFVNRFWNFMYPLLKELAGISTEID